MNIVKNCLPICFLFFSSFLFGQEAKEEFRKINNAYANLPVAVDVSYRTFINYTAPNPIDEVKGKYIASGKMYYQEIGHIINYGDSLYLLQANTEDQTLMLSDRNNNSHGLLLPFSIDDFMASNTSVALLKSGERRMTIVFGEMNLGYEKITMVYDTATYFIRKTTLYFQESQSLDEESNLPEGKPRVEINYSKNTGLPFKDLLQNNFYKKSGNNIALSEEYKNYELLDNRNLPITKRKKNQ